MLSSGRQRQAAAATAAGGGRQQRQAAAGGSAALCRVPPGLDACPAPKLPELSAPAAKDTACSGRPHLLLWQLLLDQGANLQHLYMQLHVTLCLGLLVRPISTAHPCDKACGLAFSSPSGELGAGSITSWKWQPQRSKAPIATPRVFLTADTAPRQPRALPGALDAGFRALGRLQLLVPIVQG